MKHVILITGASSGFGALTARRLAEAGHTVYATMRETNGRNAKQVEAARKFAAEKNVDLRTAELDVSSGESADRAVHQVLTEAGRFDVIIHNAGHMVFGPAGAFTPEQLAELYDINVQYATAEPGGTSDASQTGSRFGCLGRKQQHTGRHAPISGAILRCESTYGRYGGELRSGAGTVEY